MQNEFKITTGFMREMFLTYNRDYFNNSLKEPIFEVVTLKSKLGECSWKNIRGGGRKDYKIRLSDYFQLTEKDYRTIMLHEMIHLFIRQHDIKDTRTHHGKVFYKWVNFLNDYGWDISRTFSANGYKVRQGLEKDYSLIVFRDYHGKPFLMRYNAKYRHYFVKRFERYPLYYKEALWFTSNESEKYGSMSECYKRVSGRYISEEELAALRERYGYREAV